MFRPSGRPIKGRHRRIALLAATPGLIFIAYVAVTVWAANEHQSHLYSMISGIFVGFEIVAAQALWKEIQFSRVNKTLGTNAGRKSMTPTDLERYRVALLKR